MRIRPGIRRRMQWWDIFVQAPASLSEIMSAHLHHLGSTAVVVHDAAVLCPTQEAGVIPGSEAAEWTVLQGAFPMDADLARRVTALQTFVQEQSAVHAGSPCSLFCRPLQDEAYLTQWQQFFQPIDIAQRLCIRPPWDTTPLPDTMAPLTLDPGLAFGTGSHPTTYLALTLLAQTITSEQQGTLFDVGCGSGILSLAALKLGMQQTIGVDTDAQAIPVASGNAALNGLQNRACFLHGSWDITEEQFALITANIYLGPLVNMIRPLTHRLAPQGKLILSGILTFQETALRTALETARLRVVQRLVQDDWVALMVQHDEVASLMGMALRLSAAFGTTPELWLNLQRNYDLWQAARQSDAWRQVPALVPTE